MALQTSGAISISQIKTELGSSSNSLRTLSAAAGKSTPDAMSEFYGYASYAVPTYHAGATSISGAGTSANNYVVNPSVGDEIQEEVDVSVEYGYEPGTALLYYVNSVWTLMFKIQSTSVQRVNHRITTWNNNSQSGCLMSNAATYSYNAFPFTLIGETSECAGCNGAAALLNRTVTSPYQAPSINAYSYITGFIRQLYKETFQGSNYYYCSGSLSTSACTVRVWFDKQ
jgi:hypothetical protein